MRSILIISDSYYPDPGIQARRIGERAEYLTSKGLSVTIYCPTSIYSSKNNYIHKKVKVKRIDPFFIKTCIHYEYWNLKKSLLLFKLLPFIAPIFGYIRWIIPAIFYIRKQTFKNTILYTYNNPITLHIIGLLTKNRFKRWIAELRDPLVNYEFSHRSTIFRNLDITYEKMIVKRADKICFRKGIQMSKKEIVERNPDYENKIIELPDYGVNLKDYMFSTQNHSRENLVGLFAGAFYGKSSPNTLIESINNFNYQHKSKIEIHFYGNTIIESTIHIKNFGKIQYEDLIKKYKDCDFTIIYDQAKATASKKYFVPSKLSELIAAQKPILYIGDLDTLTAKIIHSNSIGVISEDKKDFIHKAICELQEMILMDSFNYTYLKQVSREIDLLTSEEKFFELTF